MAKQANGSAALDFGALRMIGMADALEVRTREALEMNLAPMEHLGILLLGEVVRQELVWHRHHPTAGAGQPGRAGSSGTRCPS
jgi:hypothetical protein